MRIDFFLKKVCLIPSRRIAKLACNKSLVLLNGTPAKPSKDIHLGDQIEVKLYGFKKVFKVKSLPKGNVAKRDAQDYYTLLESSKLEGGSRN